MKKSLLLNILKPAVLFLFAIAFFLPFVTGNHVLLGDFSDSLWNIQDFATRLGDTAASPVIYVVLFVLIAIAASLSLFYKKELSRVAYLVALGVGLLVVAFVYYQVFIDLDPALEAAIDLGAFNMSLGFGVYLQLVLLVAGVVLEFMGEKLFKD